MSLFRYEAVDRAGKLVRGVMDAPTPDAVAKRLAETGYEMRQVTAAASGRPERNGVGVAAAASPAPQAGDTLHSAPVRANALFFRQLAQLVHSGMSLQAALENLGPRTADPSLCGAAAEMAQAARTGGRISEVMERHPRVFPEHLAAAVRAGELGGFIEHVLDEVAYDFEQETAFQRGMWFPKMLVVGQLLTVALAQPIFPHLFPNNTPLVFLKIVMLRNVPIALGLILLYRLVLWFFAQPKHRDQGDRVMVRLPGFGRLARQKSIAAFVRTFRRLAGTSVGPIGSWEGAMYVAPNAVVRGKLADAYALVQQNVPLNEAFRVTGLFEDEMEQLLATGVVSGQVRESLDRMAEYYQENVAESYRNARMLIFRGAILIGIILGGAAVIWMTKNYFDSVFKFADSFNE